MAKRRPASVSTQRPTKRRGALKNLADQEGYEEFVVPDDVGGRYSVLTAVGLLPIAVSGADIDKLMEGAASGRKKALEQPYEANAALQYAAVRNILLRKGKQVEITANYEPSLHYVSSGGNSCTERVKERTTEVSYRHPLT